ncbi:MAG TPA: carboxypeptidase-like regulatory domain-containing protein, partial [Candidatus Acidoferrales bacterium]|nr:carboxypeptidase-like regulatory domain-containing protein [Candidatus Acidoferrales bacterium]
MSAIILFLSALIAAGGGSAHALDVPRGTELLSPIQQSSQQRIPGQAPQKTGALQGVVRDGSKNPIIAASVVLRNLATGREQKKSSDAQGVFRFIDVLPGQYDFSVDAPGYAKFTEDGIEVSAGSVVIREIKLTAIPATIVPSTSLPQLPPRAGSNNAAAAEAPPSIGYPETKENLGLNVGVNMPAPEPPPSSVPVFSSEPDRWLLTMPDWNRYGTGGEHPYVKGKFWDPFDTNKLKGDVPIFGQQTFFNFTAISDTFVDGRRLPTPTGESTALPGTTGFFGNGNQAFVDQVFLFSFDLFHGDTSFRPVDWRIRITPAISVNYLDVQETGIVNVNVNKGTTRLDSHIGLQEAFAEVKLHDLSPNFDFISVRAGIQGFNSDFRGFLFVEEQPGVRFFGNLESNRWQYNLAYFNFLEKNTNSGLNSMKLRDQQVIIANVYRQDFLFQGYTAQFSVHYNNDEATLHFDDNGFLVRPAP